MPNLSTNTFQWAKGVVDAMLSALKTAPSAALLTTPHVELFTGATVPSALSLYSAFTAPTFHGYSASAITLTGPVNETLDTDAMIANANFLASSGGTIADTATGYIVSDGVSTYYGGERFQSPQPFANPGDYIALELVMPLPLQQSTNT